MGSELAPDGRAAAREFDERYRLGSPEYNSYLQRLHEGMPVVAREIALVGKSKDDAILAQTAAVAEYVRQDCEVAYGS
ncbi:hypothetical protein [Streptomyces sp. NPDC056527]|uniref:hypothetical protein n=1 Tax=Streptomyces sp. NPDC056527 TaxID=3345853 RepID=UPI0036872D22